MAIKKQSGRQDIKFGRIEFGYADVDGTNFTGAIELPHGARVLAGVFEVDSPAQAGVTVNVGDAASGNRYKSAIPADAAGRTALVATGYKTPAEGDVGVTFSVAPTQGAFALELQYVIDGRVESSQGLDYRGPGIPGA